jgi:PilZ domain
MHERREEPRRPAEGVRGRVRLGHGLLIVDVSSRGALVEGRSPLRPGSRVEVQLETDARRELIAARVMRCGVVAIDPEAGVTYRAALAFTETCEWVREHATRSGYALPVTNGRPEPPDGDGIPATVRTEQK